MIIATERKEKESAKDYVLNQLIYNIVHFNLLPGQQLETAELCKIFKVSTNPIREAELELMQKRLVEIKPKVGVFVTFIDTTVIEEIRELRSVLEAELARKACDLLTKEQIDLLWENVAMWRMYISRNDEEKIFMLDKKFHEMLYHFCNKPYWCQLVNDASHLFDRTTVLSFKCKEKGRILNDHEELIRAIEERDKERAAEVAKLHLTRYTENLATMKAEFEDYFLN